MFYSNDGLRFGVSGKTSIVYSVLIVIKVVGSVLIHTLISYTASRKSVVTSGCLIDNTMYLLSPRSFVDSTLLPCNRPSNNPESAKCSLTRRWFKAYLTTINILAFSG